MYQNELPILLSRQTPNRTDPELLSWEIWTNELIKWSEQNYRYTIPQKPIIKHEKVAVMHKKYLALFLKELNDRNPNATSGRDNSPVCIQKLT